ncbi:hypothetical protein TKK_0010709 [Trichogramma kaykai]|uniref:Peptidase S1 domain-containing protein n=1 Tax=Trichogramma kaykai TaxID=54128 RepID=A0ABD2WXB0_9HYME
MKPWVLLFGLYLFDTIENSIGIINGRRSFHLFAVSLQYITKKGCSRHYCGGSILDDRHILTAVTCLSRDNRTIQDRPITVVAGTDNLANRSEGAIDREVETIFVIKGSKLSDDNVAILRLKRPLPLRKYYLEAVPLPPAGNSSFEYGTGVLMQGFGVYQQFHNEVGQLVSGPMGPFLKKAHGIVKDRDVSKCPDGRICVTSVGFANENVLEGICDGDEGGPLVKNYHHILIGIATSERNPICGIYQRFVEVAPYLGFIENVTSGGIDDTISSQKAKQEDLEGLFNDYPHCIQDVENHWTE